MTFKGTSRIEKQTNQIKYGNNASLLIHDRQKANESHPIVSKEELGFHVSPELAPLLKMKSDRSKIRVIPVHVKPSPFRVEKYPQNYSRFRLCFSTTLYRKDWATCLPLRAATKRLGAANPTTTLLTFGQPKSHTTIRIDAHL